MSKPPIGPNNRPQKEKKLNLVGPEVLALIHAKEMERDTIKLSRDSRDQMQKVALKWTKIAIAVAKAGCSTYLQRAAACYNKWQTVFGDYKKIYEVLPKSNRQFNRRKRRKELTYLPTFVQSNTARCTSFSIKDLVSTHFARQTVSMMEIMYMESH